MRLCSPFKLSMSSGEPGGQDTEVYNNHRRGEVLDGSVANGDVYPDHQKSDAEQPSNAVALESETACGPSHQEVIQTNSPAHLRNDSADTSAVHRRIHQVENSSFGGATPASSQPQNKEFEGVSSVATTAAAAAAAFAHRILHQVSSEAFLTSEQSEVGDASATAITNPLYQALHLASLSHLHRSGHVATEQHSSTQTRPTVSEAEQRNQAALPSNVSHSPLQQVDHNAHATTVEGIQSQPLGVESVHAKQQEEQADDSQPTAPPSLLAPPEHRHCHGVAFTHQGRSSPHNTAIATGHVRDGYQQSGEQDAPGHSSPRFAATEVPRPRSNSVPANPSQAPAVLTHEVHGVAHNQMVLQPPTASSATEQRGEVPNDNSHLLVSPSPSQSGGTNVAPSTPLSKPAAGLRRGKWTPEEEAYVARVIQDFNSGYLNAPAGTTLRTYLSDKLNCDPMRITKKFTGDACIGKRVFHPAVRCATNAAAIDKAQAELDALERRWRRRLELQQRESAKKAASSSSGNPSARSPQNRQQSIPQDVSHQQHLQVPKQSYEQQQQQQQQQPQVQVQVHHGLVPQHVQPAIQPQEIAAAPAPPTTAITSSVTLVAAPSAVAPALIAPATTGQPETPSSSGAIASQNSRSNAKTALLDDSVVTRTATWLDQANAILSSKDVSIESFHNLFAANQGPSGLIGNQNQHTLLLPAAVKAPATARNSATASADVETQMQEVRRLIHEGPFIMEQASTAGLSSKLLLGQSIRSPDLAESARSSSTGALGSKPSMLSTGRGPNEQPPASVASGLGASSSTSDMLRPGKRKLTGELVGASQPESQQNTSVFPATDDRTALFSLAGEAANVGRNERVMTATTSEHHQQREVAAPGVVQQGLTDQASAALHSLQQQQEFLPRRAFSANQLSLMSSRGTNETSSGGCAMQETTTEDAAQALVGFLNSVRAESFRAAAAADSSSNAPQHATASAAGTRIREEE